MVITIVAAADTIAAVIGVDGMVTNENLFPAHPDIRRIMASTVGNIRRMAIPGTSSLITERTEVRRRKVGLLLLLLIILSSIIPITNSTYVEAIYDNYDDFCVKDFD